MPEKLLSIKEVADYLRVSEEEVKRLVDVGEIPAYKIGGTFLRFRKDQIEAIRTEISEVEEERGAGPYNGPSRQAEPPAAAYDYTFGERVIDFLRYNDFYIASFVIIAVLMYFIFKT